VVTTRPVRLATRGSDLAVHQARLVGDLLQRADANLAVELVVVETTGDRRLDVPLGAFAGQGVFVVEVERAVLDGRADVAVHSAKDLPSGDLAAGLVLASVPDRADPRDVLVGRSLGELAPGATVATGAPRRRAQLAHARPDLHFSELRGNIATRLGKVPDGGAIVVALAALRRLGLESRVDEVLPVSVMLPQVGQGALALRCREGDAELRDLLGRIDLPGPHRCILAERAFLARLGGGCDAPVAAYATTSSSDGSNGPVTLDALVASADGRSVLRRCSVGEDPVELGTAVAEEILGLDGAALVVGDRAAVIPPVATGPDAS